MDIFSLLNEEEYRKYILGMPYPEFCSDLCNYLNITEYEQNLLKVKPNHICLKYNQRIKHGPFHPKLIRCNECIVNRTLEEVLQEE